MQSGQLLSHVWRINLPHLPPGSARPPLNIGSWHSIATYQFHFISQRQASISSCALTKRKFHSTGAQDLMAEYLYIGMCSSWDFLKTFHSMHF